jgi:hypothetical protein
MKTLRWFILLTTALAYFKVNAQAKLGIVVDSFPSQIVLTGNVDTVMGSFHIYNYGDSTFNGSFTLNYVVGGVQRSSSLDSGIFFPSTSVTILAGDSSIENLFVHYDPNVFSIVGVSGVVIWPVSPTAATFDSTLVQIEVTYPAAISSPSSQKLEVYLNQQQLFINEGGENLVKRVRIYTTEGQLLTDLPLSSSAVIAMNKYASGFYIAELILNDDSRRVFKLANIADR